VKVYNKTVLLVDHNTKTLLRKSFQLIQL